MKYIILWKGFGKFKHSPRIKKVSDKTAERIESKGTKIYHSKEEAEEDI